MEEAVTKKFVHTDSCAVTSFCGMFLLSRSRGKKCISVFLTKVYAVDQCQNLMLIPAGIHLLRVNNGNSRTLCEIFTKLTAKTPEQIC